MEALRQLPSLIGHRDPHHLDQPIVAVQDVSLRYQGKANTIFEDDPLYKVDSYAVVNASLGLKSQAGWSLSLWSKNLFNKF